MKFFTCVAIGLLAAPAPAEIRLQPFPDHRVLIVHEGYRAEWQLRLPEVVRSWEGAFLTYIRTPLEWRQYESGESGYDWQPSAAYAQEAFEKTSRRQQMIVGMKVSPRMKVGSQRIDLWLRLKNVSDRPFHAVHSDGGCLQHRTERFFDDRYDRTYVLTDAGPTPLHTTDRSAGIRAAYFFHPGWSEEPGTKAYEYFWGRSRTRPAAALIVSQAFEGKGAIGIAWDQCLGVRQNSDASHHCMHSSPYYGQMQPGQSVTRRGVILFGDKVEDVVEQFQQEKLQPYLGPPEGPSHQAGARP